MIFFSCDMSHVTIDTNRVISHLVDVATELQRRRAEATKDTIRDAVRALLVEEHPAAISIPAVAARAGISVRTIYRYFETKQALLDDVAEIQLRRADAVVERRQDLYDRPDEYLKVLWRDFADDVPAVKAQHQSAAGEELRRSRLASSRSEIQRRIDAGFPDASDSDRRDLVDLLICVTSSSAFLELHARLDRTPEDAARIAIWAVGAMQKQFKHDGGMR